MGELTIYEKRVANLDEVASSLRVALVMDAPSSVYRLKLNAASARELVAAIEGRQQVMVVERDVVPPAWLALIVACLMAKPITDAALWLVRVLQ